MKRLLYILIAMLLLPVAVSAADYFWVGGASGACMPGPGDNVFFDAGLATPPTIKSAANNILNIYGSSVWQAVITMGVSVINCQNTGTAKTITSNGVTTGNH